MSQPVALTPYRPGQGIYARSATGAALLLVALFASVRLFQLSSSEATFKWLGMNVPHTALWSAAMFVGLGAVVFLFTFGVHTGLKRLDARTHSVIDLLIDTESELTKVSWPGPDELRSSTTAVLVSIILLGTLLFCIDWLVAFVMGGLKVLPR